MNDERNCEDTEETRDLEDINAILEKASIIFGFRDILTKYGIPPEEKVTVSIVPADNEDLVISSAVIQPQPSSTVPIALGKNDFRAEVIDFLKKTDALFKKFVCSFPGLPDETDYKTTNCEGNEKGNEIRTHYKFKIEYKDREKGHSLAQASLMSSMSTPSNLISFSIGVCQTPPPPPIRRWMCSN